MRVVIFAIFLAYLSYLFYGYSPASAEDVNKTVKLASSSVEAKNVVSKEFSVTPNPNNFELDRINTRVEEIIVTETARVVTGNRALIAPTEKKLIAEQKKSEYDAAQKIERERYVEELKSKSFVEMSFNEFIAWVLYYTPSMILFMVSALLAVLITSRAYRSF